MQYLLRRLVLTIPVLLGVSIIVFTIMHVIPGDPVQVMFAGTGATEEQLTAMRHALGLDRPLPVQYGDYVARVVRGDFGQSIHFKQPVLDLILERMPATIELAVAGLLVALAIAFPVGILSALKRNTLIDYVAMTGATLGISLPTFWVGILFIMIFAVNLGWLPGSGRVDYGVHLERVTGLLVLDSILTGNLPALKDTLAHLVLPAGSLGIAVATFTTRLMRSSMLEVVGQDYVVTARAKGLGERVIITRHVLRNALIPVVTLVGVQMGGLLGGAVISETIFAWPGIGRLVIQAIYNRDFLLVQGVVLFFALISIVINLLTDIVYVWIDPRISHI
ncbi:MAG: ABC transporter permease [Anaerolineae bacterium]|jgi:peptide/nickel transport system permease protein|nr:ABC transporter permease [Anaerolineae bacterium]